MPNPRAHYQIYTTYRNNDWEKKNDATKNFFVFQIKYSHVGWGQHVSHWVPASTSNERNIKKIKKKIKTAHKREAIRKIM